MDLYSLTYLLAIAAGIAAMFAQVRCMSAYNKYKNAANKNGMTGAEAAKVLLESAGVREVSIEEVSGVLTDHYDPQTSTLRLSSEVYHKRSLSAVGIAAHEAGHAIQHSEGYAPLTARQNFVRVANFGSKFSFPVVILGLFFMSSGAMDAVGSFLVTIGLLMFTVVVVLTLITLPVEFNASARAIYMLETHRILDEEEIEPVRQVLTAAAWTYVAAAVSSIITLIRLILMSQKRR